MRMQQYQTGDGWFLAQYKPNSHKIAERNLRRQNFQTFVPLYTETRRKPVGFTTALRPLFTGYLFVAFDTSKGGWRAINSTYGITRLVSFGGEPQQVPPELVDALMSRCDADGILLPPAAFRVGDTVDITAGPFSEFVATVEKVDPDKRVWVLLDLMGRRTRVSVDGEAVQLV